MLCPNCHQPLAAGATFCGNCGFKIPPVNASLTPPGSMTANPTTVPHSPTPSPIQPSPNPISGQPVVPTPSPSPIPPPPGPLGQPTVSMAAPSPIYSGANPIGNTSQHSHDGLAIAALVIGVLSCIAWLIPFFGLVFCVLALIFGIISRRSRRRGFAITGIVLGSITTVLSILWIILVFVIGLSALKSGGGLSATTAQTITSPCYTAKIPTGFHLTQTSGSCTFSATDTTVGEIYEVKVIQVASLTANNLDAGAKLDVQNVLASIPGSSITSQGDGMFAGQQAYTVTIAATDGSSGTVDYVYNPTAQGNLVVVMHTQRSGTNKGLSTLENSWTWQ